MKLLYKAESDYSQPPPAVGVFLGREGEYRTVCYHIADRRVTKMVELAPDPLEDNAEHVGACRRIKRERVPTDGGLYQGGGQRAAVALFDEAVGVARGVSAL